MPLYAIAGSQGTGKSTTLAQLPQYKSVTRKTSRSILSDWNVTLSEVNNDRDLTVQFQDEILLRKQSDEKQAIESKEVWFTERTYADLFTYALIALGKDNEYSEWVDDYYERCKSIQHGYSKVFYLTAGHFTPVNDGVRGANKHYSRMVDLTMYDCTRTMGDPESVITIHTPDLAQRVQTIEEFVRFTQNTQQK